VIIPDVPRLAGHVAEVYKMSNAYKIVIRKAGGKRYLGRTRHWQEENIDV
jgi:hypothetical protein